MQSCLPFAYWPKGSHPAAVLPTLLLHSLAARCAEACEAQGVSFMDCPISGGPPKAATGDLTIFCGGRKESFDRALPVLQCMGSHVKLLGGAGAGTAAKLVSFTQCKTSAPVPADWQAAHAAASEIRCTCLCLPWPCCGCTCCPGCSLLPPLSSSLQVNQLLVGIHSIAACEALLLADKLGVHNHEALLSCLSTSLGNSNVLQRHGPVIAKRWAQLHSEPFGALPWLPLSVL